MSALATQVGALAQRSVVRTARRLFAGSAYIAESVFDHQGAL